MAASRSARRLSARPRASSISPCTAVYFSLPSVRFATMLISAAPVAPASAAAAPPPGSGADEASLVRNASMGISGYMLASLTLVAVATAPVFAARSLHGQQTAHPQQRPGIDQEPVQPDGSLLQAERQRHQLREEEDRHWRESPGARRPALAAIQVVLAERAGHRQCLRPGGSRGGCGRLAR